MNKYPQAWVQEYLGCGRTTTKRAKAQAVMYGPGHPLPDSAKQHITRDRRSGEKESFFINWMTSKDNVECTPCIKRDRISGKLMKQASQFRLRNRNCGYNKYINDAKAMMRPYYCRDHFYTRNKEMTLKDTKSDAGLSPSCNQY